MNADIAAVFEEIADRLELQGDNPFRIRAYRNAARTLTATTRDLRDILEKTGELPRMPGIGADLAAKIREIITTGHCGLLDRLRRDMPQTVTDLLQIPGLGPKRVRLLYHDLGIATVEQLDRAAREGRIRGLPGFGAKTEQHILDATRAHLNKTRRFLWAQAAPYAQALRAELAVVAGVEQVTVAGSFRRRRETVGDLDVLATAAPAQAAAVIDRFTHGGEVAEVLSAGDTRASVVLRNGLQVDLRVVAAQSYGAALHYFTGSKAHSIALRRLAQAKGLKINEYGVFRGATRIAGADEASVYASVGLPYIEPELRENTGEIDAARRGKLPHLVDRPDIKGDLHVHTTASDGRDPLRDMALAAQRNGLRYLAIAQRLDAQRLLRQSDDIDRLNADLTGITLLKGVEVSIRQDGSLDLPDAVLARLDLVVAAVHDDFDLPRQRQTERLLRAMDHPHFTILAHPCGRLIDAREPMVIDMLRIIRHARQRGCFLELNAQPDRLDLNDTHCRMAKEEGVL
ncbi:MAG: DNA polymerase/3'-5' exonuclease PolX, partial [Thiomonas sp.]